MWTNSACGRELEVRKLARTQTDDPSLRMHIAECRECQETLAVACSMQELAALPLNAAPLPDADYLWWKARILQQWEAERAMARPIEIGEHVQIGIGAAGTVALLIWIWRELQPQAMPAVLLAVVASGVFAVGSAILTSLFFFRNSGGWRAKTF